MSAADDGSSTVSSRSSISTIGVSNNVVSAVTKPCDDDNDTKYRAVHQIDTVALGHNYHCVEAAASSQQCNVIVVVKADGYGHGAITSALHLADSVGADAFAVATLEEGISLRKALQNTAMTRTKKKLPNGKLVHVPNGKPPTQPITKTLSNSSSQNNSAEKLSTMFQPPPLPAASPPGIAPSRSTATTVASSTAVPDDGASSAAGTIATASTLGAWTIDSTAAVAAPAASVATTASLTGTPSTTTFSRRSAFIRILVLGPPVGYPRCFDDYYYHQIECMVSGPEVASALLHWAATPMDRQGRLVERTAQETRQQLGNQRQRSGTEDDDEDDDEDTVLGRRSATLTGTSGNELAKEFRQLLLNSQKETVVKRPTTTKSQASSRAASRTGSPIVNSRTPPPPPAPSASFGGIEAAVQTSRIHEKVVQQQQRVWVEDSSTDAPSTPPTPPTTNNSNNKRRLKWHALVDSGMGRLGFKTDYPLHGDRRDTVEILQELVAAEQSAPLEFYGMCTHMADATSTSTYSNEQISKFKSLLKRVRDAGISVPTVSTDNSAALLTTTLNHFDPTELLTQKDGLNTRGFVRTGGAIYGQRPAFTQLKPVSTLVAAVRHVAILQAGESVGYDRAYIATQAVRIATLTIGFADGYPRELGKKKGKVAIRNQLYPVAGNVCMDMMMVELGAASDECDVKVGDVAVMWGGSSGMTLQQLAGELKTTQSALTCGLNKTRVLREYV